MQTERRAPSGPRELSDCMGGSAPAAATAASVAKEADLCNALHGQFSTRENACECAGAAVVATFVRKHTRAHVAKLRMQIEFGCHKYAALGCVMSGLLIYEQVRTQIHAGCGQSLCMQMQVPYLLKHLPVYALPNTCDQAHTF